MPLLSKGPSYLPVAPLEKIKKRWMENKPHGLFPSAAGLDPLLGLPLSRLPGGGVGSRICPLALWGIPCCLERQPPANGCPYSWTVGDDSSSSRVTERPEGEFGIAIADIVFKVLGLSSKHAKEKSSLPTAPSSRDHGVGVGGWGVEG